MTVSTTTSKVSYAGNGSTTAFAVNFYFLDNTHLKVILRAANGTETVKTLGTDYTVSGAGVSSGGTVTMTSAPASGTTLVVLRNVPATQLADYTPNDPFPAQTHEQALDKLTMLVQQQQTSLNGVLKFPDTDSASLSATLPPSTNRANKALVFDEDGGVGLSDDDYANQVATVAASATAAAGSATAAAASASSAAASASAASGSATSASSSATSASASAAAAAASIASALWRDVVFVTYANSPITISQSDNGKMYCVDTTGGNVVVNLPTIAGITTPFNVSFKKESADSNSVNINRGGTDTIDGATSKSVASAGGGTTLMADTDPSPDQWIASDFGAVAGNMVKDVFSGNASTTSFTLTASPGSANNVAVYIGGVRQVPTTDYTVSGTTLSFTSAPPTGTNNILAITGTTLSVGTPADGTVTTTKIVDEAVTTAKMADGSVTSAKMASGAAAANLGLSAWSVVESGGVLYFKYSGTNKFKIDSSGNLTVAGNVTAYGTV